MITLDVLYRNGLDSVLFEFIIDNDTDDVEGLIQFHFEERHDFNECVIQAKSIFPHFYNEDEYEIEGYEFITYEERKTK